MSGKRGCGGWGGLGKRIDASSSRFSGGFLDSRVILDRLEFLPDAVLPMLFMLWCNGEG